MAEAGGAYNLRSRTMTAEVTGPAPVPPCSTPIGHWYHHRQGGTLHWFPGWSGNLCLSQIHNSQGIVCMPLLLHYSNHQQTALHSRILTAHIVRTSLVLPLIHSQISVRIIHTLVRGHRALLVMLHRFRHFSQNLDSYLLNLPLAC